MTRHPVCFEEGTGNPSRGKPSTVSCGQAQDDVVVACNCREKLAKKNFVGHVGLSSVMSGVMEERKEK
jgi:hypothetical protein